VGAVGRGSARRPTYVVAAVATLVLGLGLVALGLGWSPWSPSGAEPTSETSIAPPPPERPAPHASHPTRSAASTGVADQLAGPVLPESRPVRVEIPRLHVVSPLESLGVGTDGTMDVPVDPARAGWYTEGPTPGALGPAVIAGHVTWNGAPAVFRHLATLRPGDRVRVDRADHRVAVFAVTRVEEYPKERFPTGQVFGGIDHAGLRLITCAGEYDPVAHHYADNVVVFARLVRG
jgi:hypothetical protein